MNTEAAIGPRLAGHAGAAEPIVLVDAHVHLHDGIESVELFDAADRNVREAAAKLGYSKDAVGCLCFTECAGVQAFKRLATRTPAAVGPWSVTPTAETCSLLVRRDDLCRLVLIAGRQIVTSEGLEVLAIATDDSFSDGHDLAATVDLILSRGGVAVVPWGFGKWWLKRGACLDEFLDRFEGEGLFLGDNAARPGIFRRPRQFDKAVSKGMWILPGTDPMPTASGTAKVASFGFILQQGFDMDQPGAGLVSALRGLKAQPQVYGDLESLPRFIRDQIHMNVRKRLAR